MSICVVPVKSRRDMRAFRAFPRLLYAHDPLWHDPLSLIEQYTLSQRLNPYWRHADRALFLAWRDGRIVGRIGAHVDYAYIRQRGEDIGLFGFFACENDMRVAQALFDAAGEWLRGQGMRHIMGPCNPGTHDEPGFLLGEATARPSFMMAHNPEYYSVLAEQCGFVVEKECIDYDKPVSVPTPPGARRIAKRLRNNPRVHLHHMTQRTVRRDSVRMCKLYNEIWKNNWGYTPVTSQEAYNLALFLRLFGHTETSVIAYYDDEPVGLCVAIPDINELMHHSRGRPEVWRVAHLLYHRRRARRARTFIMGVTEEVRHMGMIALLYDEVHTFLQETYDELHFGWVLEDNTAAHEMMAYIGGVPRRRYRVVIRPV